MAKLFLLYTYHGKSNFFKEDYIVSKEKDNIKLILEEIERRKRQTTIFFFERGLTVAENIIRNVEGLEQGYQDDLF